MMGQFNPLRWLSVLLVAITSGTIGLELSDFTQCCDYCRGDLDLWSEIQSNWSLVVQEEEVVNFWNPPAHLTQDEQIAPSTVYEHDYNIKYGGAPVKIMYSSLASANTIKSQQYLQLDLGTTRDLAGVGMQGGFYEDVGQTLLYRTESWVTHFLASYSTNGVTFNWVGGSAMMLEANYDADTYVIVGFPSPVSARYLRIHPIQAANSEGSTDEPLFRVSPIECVTAGSCQSPRINCWMMQWEAWGECTCTWAGCRHTRMREVGRHSACGGAPCEHREEVQECIPETPLWKTLLMYIGIGLLVIAIILAIAIPLCIKYKKKKDEESPVFNHDAAAIEKNKEKERKKKEKERKEREKKEKKEQKEREKAEGNKDKAAVKKKALSDKERIQQEEKGDLVEENLDPEPPPVIPAVETVTETPVKKEKKKKKKKKAKVGAAKEADAPVVVEEKRPLPPAPPVDTYDLGETKDLGELGTEIDGLYMVKRDENMGAPAPALPEKTPLPQEQSLSADVDKDIDELFGAEEKSGMGGLPPLGGAGGGLPPLGGGGLKPKGGLGGLPPVGEKEGKSTLFMDDWEDPPPYSP